MCAKKIISLFSGMGGLDLGLLDGFDFLDRHYRRLDTEIVFACESDPATARIYEDNIGPVVCCRAEEVCDFPAADWIIGGPPCQPYSQAGKGRGAKDQRDGLFIFVDVVAHLRPSMFLLENVPGLMGKKCFALYHRFENRLRKIGYEIKSRILNSADYGLPQIRRRLFVLGMLGKSPGDSIWPRPTHGEKAVPGCASWITCREAIADLIYSEHRLPISKLCQGQRRYPAFGAGARRQYADRPMFTITATDSRCGKMYHPWFDRALTTAELKRGQGFPDNFIAPDNCAALGNAVPPPLAHAIFRRLTEIY